MNLLHMKYAVEVARQGSLSRASEVLLTAQPNISRSIKELEADLGVVLFTRSQKGMVLTPEGEDFIGYAKAILRQLDEVELLYKTGGQKKQRLTVSAPRASYISEAITDLSRRLGEDPVELVFRESSTRATIDSVLEGDFQLGIIRYADRYDRYFKDMLTERGLSFELVAEFRHILLMRRDHPLAGQETVAFEALRPYIEVAYADPYIPATPPSKNERDSEERPDRTDRRILLYSRATALDILAGNPEAFMWSAPVPDTTLARHGLVMRDCPQNEITFRDLIIHREDHRLTHRERQFVTALCDARRRCIR